MKYFTEAQARALAKHDKGYCARKIIVSGITKTWVVWDDKSDHHVEFDRAALDNLTRSSKTRGQTRC